MPALDARMLPLALTLVAALLAGPVRPAAARTQDVDPATRSAIYLLEQTTQVRRDGQHNRLLRALRHLEDPGLAPLFAGLATTRHPALRIHGILGLAEVSPDDRLDLTRLAEITNPAVQYELITAALDSELLDPADARQLLTWDDIDLGVKLVIATRLLEQGQFNDVDLLKRGLEANHPGRRGLAALLLHQLGDPAGVEGLTALDRSDGPERDKTRETLLVIALRHDFHRVANWAFNIAIEPGVNPTLELLALRTAMRFGDPRAPAQWRQEFESTTDLAQRTRLALGALQLAPWLEANVFDVLIAAPEPLLQQVGRAGKAIASGSRDVPDQVVALIQMHHPLANSWALSYAANHAEPVNAQLILLGIVLAYEQGPEQGRSKLLDDAIEATELLFELDPAAAANLLRPILASPETDPVLVRAILLGMVRTQALDAPAVLADLPTFTDPEANHLALLLRAKHGLPLNESQMRDLALLVQGGGGLQDALRIQAAWAWLKRTGQVEPALAQVLKTL